MARKKLARFKENESFRHVIEPAREDVVQNLEWRGKWNEFFGNDNPIVLELGCGKGEYTVAMAKNDPDKNFIGVDIKGSRIWYGATEIQENNLNNGAFLRTQIELLEYCFAENEVSEIWITFPDPQIKYKRVKHRLTNPDFLKRYAKILKQDGLMHLKTDSEFLHGYTHGILQALDLPVHRAFHDIDLQIYDKNNILHSVRTHYEGLFREKGKAITYIQFGVHG
ncbi:tRNA (guanosine(46)-N7)-methyltransferase TrmB [Owenweeksia hongkongensis]|uniref:tRNA (guanosine(46)-N7)-methyltransferase TrmB n=1 Tax=Owenweeksia hongkongensis TaxID=253245 RepID=UPI003A958D93